jgi:hypothetical protein
MWYNQPSEFLLLKGYTENCMFVYVLLHILNRQYSSMDFEMKNMN